MTNLLSSVDSFHYSKPLTSTPKRSNKSYYFQPLSSTLSISTNSCKKMDLSISAITFIKKSSLKYQRKRRQYHYQRRIELKQLLYATRAMKQRTIKQSHNQITIYVI